MTLAPIKRRLAAISWLTSPVRALTEREESCAFARLQTLRERVINPKVAEFGGLAGELSVAAANHWLDPVANVPGGHLSVDVYIVPTGVPRRGV
jgi:hypothetical protein